MNQRIIIGAMCLLSMLALVVTLLSDPIAQDPLYHEFSDSRNLLSIPNFFNVVSNVPFLIVGLLGLIRITQSKVKLIEEFKVAYLIFFSSVFLTALGSAYYHWWPTNESLIWDRLPMTLAFMSLFSIIIAEFISIKTARRLIWPLLVIGLFSVLYWMVGELKGQGDLRIYVLVQFLPIILSVLILLGFTSRFSNNRIFFWLIICYALAKLLEHFDEQVYSTLKMISGHSLKHIIVAWGLWLLLEGLSNRTDHSDKA